jgi:UDP-N-acetylmuramoylalanine-D-glutamate ligase
MAPQKLIKNYINARQAIYDHVGFVPDWVVLPLDDQTESYWEIIEERAIVRWADSQEELLTQEGNCYDGSIYIQRFYDKYVYRGKEITMVFVDTHTDGMAYFMLFDNKKEIK